MNGKQKIVLWLGSVILFFTIFGLIEYATICLGRYYIFFAFLWQYRSPFESSLLELFTIVSLFCLLYLVAYILYQTLSKHTRLKKNSIIYLLVMLFGPLILWLFTFIGPGSDDFYRSRTGAEVMAERWPDPDFNDPNFLADFRYYMGFDFYNSDDSPVPITDFSDEAYQQARRRLKDRMSSEPDKSNKTNLQNLTE